MMKTKQITNKEISIIIPAYNEEKRLNKNLIKIIKYCKNKFIKYEIIIIDDGSNDKTIKVCQQYKKDSNIKILKNKKNTGKGYSVKKGILNSKYKLILFTDSDLSTPINELNKLLKYIYKYDIVIGSRNLKQSNVKNRLYKKILGKTSNKLISLIVKNIKDTQCGFKLFNKETAYEIFKKQTINRWGFDFEILFLAQKYNLTIKEIPVKWTEDKESKVKLSDYPKTLIELIKIKINDIQKKYDKKIK